ncbi:MAG: HEAT repeat domain-containing protein [Thermoguttaceae bacterium]|jgi:HEAT repeat protein
MNSRGVWIVLSILLFCAGSTVLGEESKPPADPPASGRQPAARVLIDASKSNLPLGVRQNNVVIDLLRSKDYEVVVVRRGEAVSEQTLKGIDVAIRPRIFLPCSAEEIAAYRAAVSGGMRLLLFGQSRGYPDPVAEGLGLSFAESQRMGPVSRSVDHACTKDLSQLPSPWVEAEKTPPGTIALAWCGTDQAKSSPVMGYCQVGKGAVVFIGTEFPQGNNLLIVTEIVRCLLGTPSGSLAKELQSANLKVAEVLGPKPPRLISPAEGVELPQGVGSEWRFEWEGDPNAQSYQIVVVGASASVPMMSQRTQTPYHSHVWGGGYIGGRAIRNLTWQVKSRDAAGNWGQWSEPRHFHVTPPDPTLLAAPPTPSKLPPKAPPPAKRSISIAAKDLDKYEQVEVVAETANVKTGQNVIGVVKKGEKLAVVKRTGPWLGVAKANADGQLLGWVLANRVRSVLPAGFDSRRAPPEIGETFKVAIKHTQFAGMKPAKVCFELSLTNTSSEAASFQFQGVELRFGGQLLKIFEGTPVSAPPVSGSPFSNRLSVTIMEDEPVSLSRSWEDLPHWQRETTIAPGQTRTGWLAFEVPPELSPSSAGQASGSTADAVWLLSLPLLGDAQKIDLLEIERKEAIEVRRTPVAPKITILEFGSRINGINAGEVVKAYKSLWESGDDCVVLFKKPFLLIDGFALSRLRAAGLQEGWRKVNSYWVNLPRGRMSIDMALAGGSVRLANSEANAVMTLLASRRDGRDLMLNALGDPSPEMRQEAASSLGGHAHRREVMEALLKAVKDEADQVRASAIYAIDSRLSGRSSWPSLMPLIKAPRPKLEGPMLDAFLQAAGDQSPSVRGAAIRALRNTQDARATEVVIRGLQDSERIVRFAAIDAAGAHPADKVGPALIKQMENADPQTALLACRCLAKLGVKACIPKLKELQKNQKSPMAGSIVDALKDVGEITAADAIVMKLDAGSYLSPDEKKALIETKDPRSIAKLQEVMAKSEKDYVAENAACLLAEMGEASALEPLLKRLALKERVSPNVTRALAKLGDKRAIEPLQEAPLGFSMGGGSAVREALLTLGAPGVREQVLAELARSPQSTQTSWNLWALRRAEGQAAIPVIDPFLDNEQWHITAASIMWDLGTPEAVAAIKKRLIAEDYRYGGPVIRRIVESAAELARAGDETVRLEQIEKLTGLLKEASSGKNAEGRTVAIDYLAELSPAGEESSR